MYGMTDLRALLSHNIKKRREKLGISQAVLAEKADTSTNYIAQIEQQNKFPSSEMLERIAVALEFDSSELFAIGPFPMEAIQQFQEGVKKKKKKRIERLMKSNK
jgi:transcriptional regulator with XRE-family HTH domain